MAELRGLGEVNAELKRRGGRLWAISVDSPRKSREVVNRNKLEFPILADIDRKVIAAFGLVHEGAGPHGRDIALPAHVLIDRQGRIAWRHVAKRIQDRPNPKDVLEQIRALDNE